MRFVTRVTSRRPILPSRNDAHLSSAENTGFMASITHMTTRATSDKDDEITALRARLRKALSERDELREKCDELRAKIRAKGTAKKDDRDAIDLAKSRAAATSKILDLARQTGQTPGDVCRRIGVDPKAFGFGGTALLPSEMARAAGLIAPAAPDVDLDEDSPGLGAMSPSEAARVGTAMQARVQKVSL